MLWQPVKKRVNYALILMLVALLAYSSIGLCIDVTPVQADTTPATEQAAPAIPGWAADPTDPATLLYLTP